MAGFMSRLVVLGMLSGTPQAVWRSPLLPLPKPEGQGYRLVTDFSALNSRIESCIFPMPNLKAMATKLQDMACFAKLDLFKGCWQFLLCEMGQEIFTMVTGEGLFSPIRVPLDMLNATSHFQAR
ncbi:unnamed protein product [Choristocarpus tenellus]